MSFHGALGCSQFMGDLLVDLATDDQIENLSLARRQGRYEPAKGIELAPLMACGLVARHGALDRVDQSFRRCRLGQEILGARLDGPHGRRRICMSGNEYDWEHRTAL